MTTPFFSCPARVEFAPYRRGYPTRVRVLEPITYEALTVPRGFVSDGASIPRIAWRLIGHPFDDRWIRSALVHDLRCSFRVGTWQETAEMFWACMAVEGNTGWRRDWMVRAVRWFGPRWPAWQAMSLDQLAEITQSHVFAWDLTPPSSEVPE